MTVLKAKIGGTFQSVLSGYASNVFIGPDPPTDPNIQFWVDSDATLPVVPWIPMVLQNGFTYLGGTTSICRYRKIADMVEIEGHLLYNGGGVYTASTFPTGFRPPKDIYYLNNFYNGAGARLGQWMVTAAGLLNWGSLPGQTAPVSGDHSSITGIRFSVTP